MLLIIYKPNIGHKIVAPIVEELSKNRPSDVRFRGTTYTKLNDSGNLLIWASMWTRIPIMQNIFVE